MSATEELFCVAEFPQDLADEKEKYSLADAAPRTAFMTASVYCKEIYFVS